MLYIHTTHTHTYTHTHTHTYTHISRRSRARRTRQTRQATQPVPADILDKIKKHDEEASKSEDSGTSNSSSASSTPPQNRKEEDKTAPTMSVFRPGNRPTPKNKVLSQTPSQQTLWSMPSKRKESTATETPPKVKGNTSNVCTWCVLTNFLSTCSLSLHMHIYIILFRSRG